MIYINPAAITVCVNKTRYTLPLYYKTLLLYTLRYKSDCQITLLLLQKSDCIARHILVITSYCYKIAVRVLMSMKLFKIQNLSLLCIKILRK